MKAVFISFATVCVLVLALSAAFAADLALPPIIRYGVNPPKYHPELCLQPGRNAYPGQVLKPDSTCPTGFRWVYQE